MLKLLVSVIFVLKKPSAQDSSSPKNLFDSLIQMDFQFECCAVMKWWSFCEDLNNKIIFFLKYYEHMHKEIKMWGLSYLQIDHLQRWDKANNTKKSQTQFF